MSHRMVVLGLVALLGCADSTSMVEPNFGKSTITVTTEQMVGSLTLGKPGTRTVDPTMYCSFTLNLTGMIPKQAYTMMGTPGVTGYGTTASSRGAWSVNTYVLKTELPLLRMYRMNADYSLTALSPDYPLMQHPNVSVTNRCY